MPLLSRVEVGDNLQTLEQVEYLRDIQSELSRQGQTMLVPFFSQAQPISLSAGGLY